MRRITILIGSMVLIVVVVASVALAVNKTCKAGTNCFGTSGPDTLTGTSGGDSIFGLGGNDVIASLGGEDDVSGGGGRDSVRGGGNEDHILGGGAADTLSGKLGNDYFDAGFGDDTVFGNEGADSVHVEDDQGAGFQDEVFCGTGDDTAYVDKNDITHDCEKLVLQALSR